MSAQVATDFRAADVASDDDLLHIVCPVCDPDTALCGAKVPGDCWMTEGLDCVVCDEFAAYPCDGCGR